jgi:D-cysteine desulfhydrase family pyridoxal phosphate-dependent enzyme
MLLSAKPKVTLAHLPTPLEPLPRLSAALNGPELWIKRDDQTGLAGGGNKTRKLEYLVGAAQVAGADTLITGGAPQSNHCRQTAAAAARAGLRCSLVLAGEPQPATGNIILDQLLGANIVWAGSAGHQGRDAAMQAELQAQQQAGHTPYLIPYGGSNRIGAAGYLTAVLELADQLTAIEMLPFDRIVFASSSGGTHAGLAVGVRHMGWDCQVLGISIDKAATELADHVADLAANLTAFAGLELAFTPDDISVNADYLGGGYGVMGPGEAEAIKLFARIEGVLLDPVYTGRAAAGLLDLIRSGRIAPGERVLLWHTGGFPALFAPQYGSAF